MQKYGNVILRLDCDSILLTVLLSCWLTLRKTSDPPHCELPRAEAHMAKWWGRPQANSQWGTQALIPAGQRHWILPTTVCRSLAAGPPQWSPEMTAALIPCSQPGKTLDQQHPAQPGPEPGQRDWVTNACCFKPLSFGANLLWSNTAINWGIEVTHDWTSEVQKKKKKIPWPKQ